MIERLSEAQNLVVGYWAQRRPALAGMDEVRRSTEILRLALEVVTAVLIGRGVQRAILALTAVCLEWIEEMESL